MVLPDAQLRRGLEALRQAVLHTLDPVPAVPLAATAGAGTDGARSTGSLPGWLPGWMWSEAVGLDDTRGGLSVVPSGSGPDDDGEAVSSEEDRAEADRLIALVELARGGDAEAFGPAQQQAFFTQPWRISPQSDRMGIRLAGDVCLAPPRRQWSLGVVTGAIQVPPDGQPIVLMADRQTMGGYPLLGFIHPLDLARLAQCPAHHQVRFAPVQLAQAQAEWRRFLAFFGG